MTINKFLEDFNVINKLLLEKEKDGFSLKDAINEIIKNEFNELNIDFTKINSYEAETLNKLIKSNLVLSFLHAIKIVADDENKYVILKYNLRYKKYYEYADFARSLVLSRTIDEPKIITQGFTKFYNLGEKGVSMKDIQKKIDENNLAYITDKLDGSNITSRFINDSLLTNTTGGLSKIIYEYEGVLQPNYIVNSEKIINENENYLKMLKDNPNISFIFEYIGSDNVIIVNYKEEEYGLKLIGGRLFLNEDGTNSRLLTQLELDDFNSKYNVGYKGYDVVKNIDEIVQKVNSSLYKGKEGVVLYIGDEIYKIKSDDYVLVHQLKMKNSLKTKDDLKQFINLLTPLIVNESIDDYISIYKGNIPAYINLISNEIDVAYSYISLEIDNLYNIYRSLNNKDFHIALNKIDLPKEMKTMLILKNKNLDYNHIMINYLIKEVYSKLEKSYK